MSKDYAQIIAQYDLPAMLWRLRDARGPDCPPDSTEIQEIVQFVRRLSDEQRRPVKTSFVHLVTLYHDGHMVEVHRRGKGPSAQRVYVTSRRLYSHMAHLCHTQGEVYGLHRHSTTYRICQYVPQA